MKLGTKIVLGLLGGAAVVGGVIAATSGTASASTSSGGTPNAGGAPTGPSPVGPGQNQVPPPAFPGFVGINDGSKPVKVGDNVDAIWAFDAKGAENSTGQTPPTANDILIGQHQAVMQGKITGGDATSGFAFQVTLVVQDPHAVADATSMQGITVQVPQSAVVPF
jgi:hypothetical protein